MSDLTYAARPLRDAVVEQMGGGTPSRQVASYWKGDIPWASVKDFPEKPGIISGTQEHISLAGLNASASNLVPARVPLVCTRMAVGRSAMSSVAMAINQDVRALFPAPDVSPSYLLRLLDFVRPKAEAQAVGSTVKGIRIQDYLGIEVPIADPPQQSKIAEVLDTLDTAINETEALIAKLKAVKQGLLQDLLTRGIDANGEVRPPQSEAPDLYKSSLLGWIPCDWEAGPLQLWLSEKPKNGYSPKEAGEWTGCQMLGLGCLTGVGFEPSQLKNAPFADARLDSVMLSDGDLLMSRANTRQLVGLVGVYSDVGTPCAYPDLMMRLKPTVETSAQYLQFFLRSPRLRRQIQAHAVGKSESMVKISGRIVRDLVVAMPDRQEQARILDALSAASTNLDSESKAVSALRDLKFGLMDDLLTGRVRVTPLLDPAAA